MSTGSYKWLNLPNVYVVARFHVVTAVDGNILRLKSKKKKEKRRKTNIFKKTNPGKYKKCEQKYELHVLFSTLLLFFFCTLSVCILNGNQFNKTTTVTHTVDN